MCMLCVCMHVQTRMQLCYVGGIQLSKEDTYIYVLTSELVERNIAINYCLLFILIALTCNLTSGQQPRLGHNRHRKDDG